MEKPINTKKLALQFIILMGFISLFADITYEGARGITGPFLSILGASAGMVGLMSGIGEFAGYMLRLPFGYYADKSKAYWTLTILGYGCILAIPFLAIAGNWQLAIVFIIIERVGKAIRSPARDAILSYSTKQIGRGLGFGIHEAMDQIGALTGPLLMGWILFRTGSYRQGFAILAIPAVLVLIILFVARSRVKLPQELETKKIAKAKLSKTFWVYTIFIFLTVLGFANFQLVSYHIKARGIFTDAQIPMLYALAMGVDAIAALIIGKMYDKLGMKVLLTIPVLTIFIPVLTFSLSHKLIIAGVVIWGIVMAIHETIMRAAIADLAPIQNRGFAYGVFNTAYGAAFFVGSTVMGFLYERSVISLVYFATAIIFVSLIFYYKLINLSKDTSLPE